MAELSEAAVRVASELQVVVRRLRRRLREISDAQDLTPSQVSVLGRVDKSGGASESDLAAMEQVRPQSMAVTLAPLEQRGLIRRDADPEDDRRQTVSLTVAGRERVEGIRRAREAWLARALQDRYTDAERRTLADAVALVDRLLQP